MNQNVIFKDIGVARRFPTQNIGIIGDSIQVNQTAFDYQKQIDAPIAGLTSIGSPGTLMNTTPNADSITGVTRTDYTADQTSRTSGLSAYLFGTATELSFDGTAAAADGGNWYEHRLLDVSLDPSGSGGGETLLRQGIQLGSQAMTVRHIWMRHAGSPTNLEIQTVVGDQVNYPANGTVKVATWDSSGATGIAYQDFDLAAPAHYDGTFGFRFIVRYPGGRTVPNGKVYIPLATRFLVPGRVGYTLTNFAVGGTDIRYWLNTTYNTVANFAALLQALEINCCIIQLGANDPGGDIPGLTFTTKLATLISNLRTANASMDIIVCSTYDINSSSVTTLASQLRTFVNAQQGRIGLVDMYKMAGPFASLDSTYLSDHVHPGAAGRVALPSLFTQGVIEAGLRPGRFGLAWPVGPL